MSNKFYPTEDQQQVLDIKEGIHLVLAPPGSGKTELLAQRVFNAKNSGFDDCDIICLTFTNRAAKGMKVRIEEKYPNNSIVIGNIHHFCYLFLFRNKLIPLNTSILDEEDTDQIFEELKKDFNYPPINKSVYNPDLSKLATYLKQKELGFSEELFLKPNASEIPEPWQAKVLCEAYNKAKDDNNYLDFDDLLTLTYYHLKIQNSHQLLLSRFKWLQVDEVQDLNPLQWAIINEITLPDTIIVYFGDYEQAIFSFMGAKLDSLHIIEKICNNNSINGIHNLLKNFRSPSYLLDIYIKYAQTHWTPTWKKPPIPNIKQEAPPKALCIYEIKDTIYSEAECITKTIIPSLLVNEDNTAILVRFNKSADIVSNSLKYNNIPHFKISGFDIFRRKSVKGLMAFFSVFLNEFDRLSWSRLFYEFEIIKNLKECRTFINAMHGVGITSIDILNFDGTTTQLIEFFNIYENQEMIVFDTETTGLDAEKDDIIQIAAIKTLNGIIKDTFDIYINTDKDVSDSEKIHHISRQKLDIDGVSHKEGLSLFLKFIGQDAILVAHNIEYDYKILTNNLIRYNNQNPTDFVRKRFDSIILAKLIHPNLASYKLKDLLDFLNVEGINSHNALDDVKATSSLIKKMHSDFVCKLHIIQKGYITEDENQKKFQKFIKKFGPLYFGIKNELHSNKQLKDVIINYFEYNKRMNIPKDVEKQDEWLKDWNIEMLEVNKLIKHIDYYTNNDNKLSLMQKIIKYIPEYRLFKESDLYLGTEKVVVSTVYKAKGLEFDNVIVAEATDDTYPVLWTLKNPTPLAKSERILEDARAFYVAMTRSKKKLFITSHTRSHFGHLKVQSRFIKCISGYFHNEIY